MKLTVNNFDFVIKMTSESGDLKKRTMITKSIMSFKTPPDPSTIKALSKRPTKRIKVLDEDEYVHKVEKIIERDFFPELERLNAQTEYIDAAERKDVDTMNRYFLLTSETRTKTFYYVTNTIQLLHSTKFGSENVIDHRVSCADLSN